MVALNSKYQPTNQPNWTESSCDYQWHINIYWKEGARFQFSKCLFFKSYPNVLMNLNSLHEWNIARIFVATPLRAVSCGIITGWLKKRGLKVSVRVESESDGWIRMIAETECERWIWSEFWICKWLLESIMTVRAESECESLEFFILTCWIMLLS